MARTESGEERSTPGGVNAYPEETGHSMTVEPTSAAAGAGEAGDVASAAVPGRTAARDRLAFGARNAAAPAEAELTGKHAEETDGAGGRSVTSADVAAGLVTARSEADAGAGGADSAVATESAAPPGGADQNAVEGARFTATLVGVPPQDGSGRGQSGLPPKPRRISKPTLAGAAIVGVVLTAIPFALNGLGSHPKRAGTGADAAAYSSSSGGGSSAGLVPSAEAGVPMSSIGTVAPSAAQPPAQSTALAGPPKAQVTPGPAAVAPAPVAAAAPVPPAPGPAAPGPAGTTVVVSATRAFMPGDSVQNGLRRLLMQNDGNLVIYDQNNHPLWSSNTAGRGYQAVFQGDGNFVVYTRDWHPVWQPQPSTAGDKGATLVLQHDGNVTIMYQGRVVWAANTAQ
jgi:hypothetical protein